MTKMKKLMSVMLAFVMSFSLMAPAMAMVAESAPIAIDPVITKEIVLEKTKESIVILRSEDLENGDARFTVINNGKIVSESYVKRSTSEVMHTNYETGTLSVQNYSSNRSAMVVNNSVTPMSNTTIPVNTTLGTVTYENYVQGYPMGTRTITYKFGEQSYVNPAYYFTGVYADIGALAGAITAMLSIPGIIGGNVAAWILACAGIAASAVNFVVNGGPVTSNVHIAAWNGISSIATVALQGSKYTFFYNGRNMTDYEGSYYAKSNYTSHNASFAGLFYERIWGNGDYEIVSWS